MVTLNWICTVKDYEGNRIVGIFKWNSDDGTKHIIVQNLCNKEFELEFNGGSYDNKSSIKGNLKEKEFFGTEIQSNWYGNYLQIVYKNNSIRYENGCDYVMFEV